MAFNCVKRFTVSYYVVGEKIKYLRLFAFHLVLKLSRTRKIFWWRLYATDCESNNNSKTIDKCDLEYKIILEIKDTHTHTETHTHARTHAYTSFDRIFIHTKTKSYSKYRTITQKITFTFPVSKSKYIINSLFIIKYHTPHRYSNTIKLDPHHVDRDINTNKQCVYVLIVYL